VHDAQQLNREVLTAELGQAVCGDAGPGAERAGGAVVGPVRERRCRVIACQRPHPGGGEQFLRREADRLSALLFAEVGVQMRCGQPEVQAVPDGLDPGRMPDLPAPAGQRHPEDSAGEGVGVGFSSRCGVGLPEHSEQSGEGACHADVGGVKGRHHIDVVGHAFEQRPRVRAEVG
jgi:hypothetical protein